MIYELLKTAYSCVQRGPVTVWFGSARPGNVIPVPKISTSLGSRSTLSYKFRFCVLLEFFVVVENSVASKKLQSPAGYEKMFL